MEKFTESNDAEEQYKLGLNYHNTFMFTGSAALKKKIEFLNSLPEEERESSITQVMTSQDFEKELLKESANEYELAVKWYKLSAEQGNLNGQYALGDLYKSMIEKGVEDMSRAEDAFYWLEKAASQGYDLAQLKIGECYLDGFGVVQDQEKGLLLMQQAAETAGIAQYNLGSRYRYGNGVERNEGVAIDWYLQALENGESWAKDEVVNFVVETAQRVDDGNYDGDKSVCIDLYETAADLGSEVAQCILGEYYRVGQYVEKDSKKSMELFAKSAEQGHNYAQFRIGASYLFGDDVNEKDVEQGIGWIKKSAENENSNAQYVLALCYCEGIGVDADDKAAFEMFELSSSQGYADAQYSLGLFYRDGVAVGKDIQKARELWKMAASQGHEEAAELLKINVLPDYSNIKEKRVESSDKVQSKQYSIATGKQKITFAIVSVMFLVSLAGLLIELISGEPVFYSQLAVYIAMAFFVKAFIHTSKRVKILVTISLACFIIAGMLEMYIFCFVVCIVVPYLAYLIPSYCKIKK
ncbi:MAG: tetratricopeptide repeat protein [Bacillota bacterium]